MSKKKAIEKHLKAIEVHTLRYSKEDGMVIGMDLKNIHTDKVQGNTYLWLSDEQMKEIIKYYKKEK